MDLASLLLSVTKLDLATRLFIASMIATVVIWLLLDPDRPRPPY